MAKKIKQEVNLIPLNVRVFSGTKDKHIAQIAQYVEEHIADCSSSKDGNMLNIQVPKTVSKKMIKLRVTKYLYQAGLKDQYRLISTEKDKASGFEILER